MKPQYGGNGKKEDPHVGGKIGDIREVAEGDLVHTRTLRGSPPGLYGPALETEHHFHGEKPEKDECSRDDHHGPKCLCYEDAVVQGQDRELSADDGNVIEVAEDVVALVSIRITSHCPFLGLIHTSMKVCRS